MSQSARLIAVVPAAGSGSRFSTSTPKQYALLHGQPVLWHTLLVLHAASRIERILVILSPHDHQFWQYDWHMFPRLEVYPIGGESRAHSVHNALALVTSTVRAEDWILVHDAARPCLTAALLNTLIDSIAQDPVGGLLAVPIVDTIKAASPDHRVRTTMERNGLWLAQTPQMFRYGLLYAAYQKYRAQVTDESGAMEQLGYTPQLVVGSRDNLKITVPEDLQYAAWLTRNAKNTK